MAQKQKATIQGEALEQLVSQCFFLTDRKGVCLERDSNPMTSFRCMEYQSEYGKIRFNVQRSAMGNGSYKLEVKDGRKTLFKAVGNYTSGPYNNLVEKYVPGEWEDKFKEEFKAYVKENSLRIGFG